MTRLSTPGVRDLDPVALHSIAAGHRRARELVAAPIICRWPATRAVRFGPGRPPEPDPTRILRE